MRHELKASYSEELIKTATRRFLIKFLGWDYLTVLIVLLVSLVALLCMGSRGWFVGAVGAVFVIGALVAVSVWIVYHRRALASLRRMTTAFPSSPISRRALSSGRLSRSCGVFLKHGFCSLPRECTQPSRLPASEMRPSSSS